MSFYLTMIIVSIFFYILMMLLHSFCFNFNIKYKIGITYAKTFLFLLNYIVGINHKIEGTENIPGNPFVIVSNHQSFWDNIFMPAELPLQSWIIKKELLDYPLFGRGLSILSPVAIDRKDSFSVRQIIDGGLNKLKQGFSIVIFPEGTRLNPLKRRKFKPSAAKLASMAKVPVLMIAHNAGNYWPKGFWIKKPGTIKVMIGPLISPEEHIELGPRELNNKIESWINDTKDKLSSQ